MLQNIECDYNHGYGTGICAGRKFVATPFVLNYGKNGGYGSLIYQCDIDGDKYVLCNYFENESVELVTPETIERRIQTKTMDFTDRFFQSVVVKYATPSKYKYSIELPDLWWDLHYVTNFDVSMFNYVHIMLYQTSTTQRRIRVCASFIGNGSDREIKLSDLVLLYDLKYYGPEHGTALINVCAEHFKYTLDMYRDECYLRLLFHPDRISDGQYVERLRMDGGRNPDTNKHDRFTIIKTVKFNDSLKQSLIEQIPCADYAHDCE